MKLSLSKVYKQKTMILVVPVCLLIQTLLCPISLRRSFCYLSYAEDEAKVHHSVGGQCEYKQYKGHAKIISINKKSGPDTYMHEVYEVKFSFIPDEEIKETYANPEGKEFLLLLSNLSYPGKAFLEKYDIAVSRDFDCYLKVIIKGTCTPILFEFPSIMLDDYFEDKSIKPN